MAENHQDDLYNDLFEVDCPNCKNYWWMPKFDGVDFAVEGVVFCPYCGKCYSGACIEEDE